MVDPQDQAAKLSALPSTGARVLAFLAIVVGGLAGGLVGWGFMDLQSSSDSTAPAAIGAFVGAVVAAAGTAVIVVLVLRAMGEWRRTAQLRDQ